MNKKHYTQLQKMACAGMLFLGISCERPIESDTEFATYPITAEVYTDGDKSSTGYLPFGGSKSSAFSIDEQTFYEGTASMRFDIPSVGDFNGSFAGGFFPDHSGRNLSEFDALTFWAKASEPAIIDKIGFGQYFGEKKYEVTKFNLAMATGWQKYIIPIPDPSKLVFERGMFWYADGPDGNEGYTFWIDNLKYEKLGTVAQPKPAIFNGQDIVQSQFTGSTTSLSGFTQTFNLVNGQNETVSVAPSYFTFKSSDNSVAFVNELGEVSISGVGTALITATLGGTKASGSLTVESLGSLASAPIPTRTSDNVISVFSDTYNNIPVISYNIPANQTTKSSIISVYNNAILLYTNLNFTVIVLSGNFNVSNMTHLHIDVQIQEPLDAGDILTVELIDAGPNQILNGPTNPVDDTGGGTNILASALTNGSWTGIDIPLNSFTEPTGGGFPGNPNLEHITQMLFVSNNISNIIVDNIYFFKE